MASWQWKFAKTTARLSSAKRAAAAFQMVAGKLAQPDTGQSPCLAVGYTADGRFAKNLEAGGAKQ
ncbi:hypothetical protein GCM10007880_62110 [Mesorhizobium amorphae]|nr:hypothetical protein GCM10007880_62110 [Mesorhizobium amorphae]